MGPRRQLGLSITFVDDDEVMGEGKGSPLGIAAIALAQFTCKFLFGPSQELLRPNLCFKGQR